MICHIRSPTGNGSQTASVSLLHQLTTNVDTKMFADDSLLFNVNENDKDRDLLQRPFSIGTLGRPLQMRFNPKHMPC